MLSKQRAMLAHPPSVCCCLSLKRPSCAHAVPAQLSLVYVPSTSSHVVQSPLGLRAGTNADRPGASTAWLLSCREPPMGGISSCLWEWLADAKLNKNWMVHMEFDADWLWSKSQSGAAMFEPDEVKPWKPVTHKTQHMAPRQAVIRGFWQWR